MLRLFALPALRPYRQLHCAMHCAHVTRRELIIGGYSIVRYVTGYTTVLYCITISIRCALLLGCATLRYFTFMSMATSELRITQKYSILAIAESSR